MKEVRYLKRKCKKLKRCSRLPTHCSVLFQSFFGRRCQILAQSSSCVCENGLGFWDFSLGIQYILHGDIFLQAHKISLCALKNLQCYDSIWCIIYETGGQIYITDLYGCKFWSSMCLSVCQNMKLFIGKHQEGCRATNSASVRIEFRARQRLSCKTWSFYGDQSS